MATTTTAIQPELAQQSAKLLGFYSGYFATWTIDLGLRAGLWQHLAERPGGVTAEELATDLGLDPLYTRVWARSAYAAGLLDADDGRTYTLAPHIDTLLLNTDAPGYLGGLARVGIALRDTFTDLREFIKTGQREWWSDMTPEFIQAVGDAGQSFYRRMINGVIPQLPDVQSRLDAGCIVLDLACGVCNGPAKMAQAYPNTSFIAVDGDRYTLDLARQNVADRGMAGRFEFIHSPLEDLSLTGRADIAIINISLHEARDIGRVVANAHRALRPGGTFLVSEFPFPETLEGCRALPGQIMSGIQFFEAHIGCQLLPSARFAELLREAGFQGVNVIDVTPVHAVIHGVK